MRPSLRVSWLTSFSSCSSFHGCRQKTWCQNIQKGLCLSLIHILLVVCLCLHEFFRGKWTKFFSPGSQAGQNISQPPYQFPFRHQRPFSLSPASFASSPFSSTIPLLIAASPAFFHTHMLDDYYLAERRNEVHVHGYVVRLAPWNGEAGSFVRSNHANMSRMYMYGRWKNTQTQRTDPLEISIHPKTSKAFWIGCGSMVLAISPLNIHRLAMRSIIKEP